MGSEHKPIHKRRPIYLSGKSRGLFPCLLCVTILIKSEVDNLRPFDTESGKIENEFVCVAN